MVCEGKRTYPAVSLVDAGRLVAILIVIAIHTGAFEDIPRADYVFSNFIKIYAVPFFFVCSGYFLGVKLNRAAGLTEYRRVIRAYGRRLLTPYLFWGVINFLVEIAVNISKGMKANQAFIEQIHSWLVTSPGRALWYVQAILILLLILLVSDKKSYLIFLSTVGIVLTFVIPCLETAAVSNKRALDLLDAYRRIFISEHNFVFYGVFFIGAVLSARIDMYAHVKNIAFVAIMAVAVVISVLARNYAFFPIAKRISMLLFSFSAFGLLLCSEAPYPLEQSLRFRELSTIFYFTHIPVKYMFQFLFQKLNIGSSLLVYCVTLIALLIYSICVNRLKQKSASAKKVFSTIY